MGSSVGRNLGLVVALLILCVVGVATAGDQFASVDNVLTILRLRLGHRRGVSVGMTFVITGGGIDLSVGAIVALASVWSTTLATQTMADDCHWIADGAHRARRSARLRAGQRRARRLRPGRAVHRDAGDAGRRARPGRDHRPAPHPDRRRPGLLRLLRATVLGVPVLVIIFAGRRRRSAGCCSTAPPSAGAPSPSAATPRRPGWPASTSGGTPCCSTSSSGSAAASPRS